VKQVPQDTVVQAISLLKQGKLVREVKRITGLSKNTVRRLRKTHYFGFRKPKGGRTKVPSAVGEYYCVRQVTKNRMSSATKVAKELKKDTGRKISAETMCRTLRKAGRGAIGKPKKSLLSTKNIRKRLSWCMVHKD
jgi:transposase